MADALEPKKKELKEVCSSIQNDFFNLTNSMNIRHNNCDPSDKLKYNGEFASLSDEEKEKWYDLLYEQGLTMLVLLDQKERNKKIDAYMKKKYSK